MKKQSYEINGVATMKLTKAQNKRLDIFLNDSELTRLRMPILLYKKNDPGLALFRVNAYNNISKMYLCIARKKPYPKELQRWFDKWSIDPSELGNNILAIDNRLKALAESN